MEWKTINKTGTLTILVEVPMLIEINKVLTIEEFTNLKENIKLALENSDNIMSLGVTKIEIL